MLFVCLFFCGWGCNFIFHNPVCFTYGLSYLPQRHFRHSWALYWSGDNFVLRKTKKDKQSESKDLILINKTLWNKHCKLIFFFLLHHHHLKCIQFQIESLSFSLISAALNSDGFGNVLFFFFCQH